MNDKRQRINDSVIIWLVDGVRPVASLGKEPLIAPSLRRRHGGRLEVSSGLQ